MSRKYFYAVLALMVACGAAVSLGELDPSVNLNSAQQLWADVLRDADDFGLQATRVSPAKEMQLGDEMAAQMAAWGTEDPADTKYANAVAAQLLPYVHRNGIRYRIHVIHSPEVNAFAIPGGHIYVLSGMLDFLGSEAELAAVLGHEMSHVDLRHCIERYQYQLAAKKAGFGGVGEIAEIAHSLVALGYSQEQESEADASGERIAIEAGYDPDAAAAVFQRMQKRFGEPARTPAKTPTGEAAGAVWDALGSFLQTHPPSQDRAKQLTDMVARNRRDLAGRLVYQGVRNFRERVSRTEHTYAEEQRIY
jgi:predicted Zn-dependent protease